MRTRLAGLLLASAVAAGCSGGSSSGGGDQNNVPPVDTARTASPIAGGAAQFVPAFPQAVRAEDKGGELYPGQANSWEISPNFSFGTGFGLQYAFALDLWAGRTTPPGSSDPGVVFNQLVDDYIHSASTTSLLHEFPFDQDASELTYLGPVFGAADGLVTVVVTTSIDAGGVTAIEGENTAFLTGTADSRLVRTVTLASGQTYTLSWYDLVSPTPGPFAGGDLPPYGPYFQVVLRNPATGALIGDPLYVSTATFSQPTTLRSTVFSTPGQVPAGPVDLSFEFRSGPSFKGVGSYAAVDAVTLTTAGGAVALANGDFEAGLSGGWRAAGGAQSQNVRSAPRVLALDPAGAATVAVTRTVYAPPAAAWSRVVDVFQNDHDAEIVTTVVYVTQLKAGPDAAWASAAGGKAMVGRDTASSLRDVGIVFGSGLASFDASAPDLGFVVHLLRVPARGKSALAHFVVQLGQGATWSGADHATPGTDAVCQSIATGFRATDPIYRQDLEPGVSSLVKNF
jgi:hypothetical protein